MTRRASFSYAFTLGALLLATLAGCSDDTMMMTDSSIVIPPRDGGPQRIEIGTGDIGDYNAVSEGDTTLLVRGSQGGQHVWVGLRAWDLDTRPALIQLILERDADGETISIPFQVRLTFQDEVGDADHTQISGLALVVPNFDDVLNERVTVRARVSENRTGGAMAEAAVGNLFVEWDPDNPPGFRPGEDGAVPDAALPASDAGDTGDADARPDA